MIWQPQPPRPIWGAGPMLLDRLSERARIDHVLTSAAQGMSAVLVLRGEPGTGKSALLDYAVESAGDLGVARIVGIESEAELAFAALHQLLVPYLGELQSLPGPLREALATAFGMREGGPPDRFLVGLASLTLLSGAASGRALLCVIDDAQWLDRESAEVLAFVARRLHADAVGMLFAVRDPADRGISLDGLPSLRVSGLSPDDARHLLASAAAVAVHSGVRDQIVAQTSGNPLALIELGRELSPAQLTGEMPLPEPIPLRRGLRARFRGQAGRLPSATQVFLLTAAADPTGDPALLWRAGRELGFDDLAASPAEASELVTIGASLTFRHPLVRSAIYYGAATAERQRAHRALAAATDPVTSGDLRAWHRSLAVSEPDEAVAAELEEAAGRARSRGGWAAAGSYLTRSAEFTPDTAERLRRILAAAQAENTAGAALRAQVLLDSVADELADPHQRIVAARLQGAVHFALSQPARTAPLLLAAARRIAPLDPGQARAALLDALAATRVSGRLASAGATVVDIARAARALPPVPAPQARVGDLLLDADTSLLLDGHEVAAPLLRRGVAALQEIPPRSPDLQIWTGIGIWAAGALGDDHAYHALGRQLEETSRAQGAVPALSNALIYTGTSELFAGAIGRARALFAEREAIEEALGDNCGVGEILVLAWQGLATGTRARAAAEAKAATGRGLGWKLVFLEYALVVLELGLGRYAEALASAPYGFEDNVIVSAFALPDLIEAAVRSGQAAVAGDTLERVARRAAASPTPLALGLLARSRAMLTDGPGAESLYQEAIAHLRQARGVSHLARAHLLYGEWLRRNRRRGDAREHLQAAHGMFGAMGAGGFAERARLELAATGQTARKRIPGHHAELTPQELQVAVLAAARSTNPEIAAHLFISPKTVDYHLGKIFRKLGVASRRELAGIQLAAPGAPPPGDLAISED
jgi:DNA-binding CsgD family transcriptional regulator